MTTSPQPLTVSPAPPETHVYTVQEVANTLKVSPWTVNRLIRERLLGSIQIGARRLVPAIDLETYLRRRRLVARGETHHEQ